MAGHLLQHTTGGRIDLLSEADDVVDSGAVGRREEALLFRLATR